MKKVLVIPLHFGDMFDKTNVSSHVHKVCKYLKRAFLLFGTRENITILYPKDPENICDPYIHSFDVDNILLHMQKIEMNLYLSVSRNDKLCEELVGDELIQQFKELQKNATENTIIFVSTTHVGMLISAFGKVMGFTKDMMFDFFSIGEVGNTEAFFFDKDNAKSVNHLRFSDYLDFFIPKKITDLTPEIIQLGAKAEKVIREHGHTKVLRHLADFVSVI